MIVFRDLRIEFKTSERDIAIRSTGHQPAARVHAGYLKRWAKRTFASCWRRAATGDMRPVADTPAPNNLPHLAWPQANTNCHALPLATTTRHPSSHHTFTFSDAALRPVSTATGGRADGHASSAQRSSTKCPTAGIPRPSANRRSS